MNRRMPLPQAEQDSKFFGFYWCFALSFDMSLIFLCPLHLSDFALNSD